MADHERLDDVASDHDRAQLANEETLRNRRITTRRGQQAKKELARRAAKRKRLFKVVAIWVGIIFVGFIAAAWFLPGVITWLKGFFH